MGQAEAKSFSFSAFKYGYDAHAKPVKFTPIVPPEKPVAVTVKTVPLPGRPIITVEARNKDYFVVKLTNTTSPSLHCYLIEADLERLLAQGKDYEIIPPYWNS